MLGRRPLLIFAAAFMALWLIVGLPIFSRIMTEAGLEEQLLVWLPLDGEARDYSENQYPVTLNGDVQVTDEGALFDGEGDFLTLPHQPLDQRPFAIAMWVKLEGDAPTFGLLEQLSPGGLGKHLHVQLRQGKPFLSYYSVNTYAENVLSREQGWTHLVVQLQTKDVGPFSQIWINGELDASRNTSFYTGTMGDFVIGKTKQWSNVPSSDWEGLIRDFRIYGRALSGHEIRTLAKEPRSAPELESPEPLDVAEHGGVSP